MGVKTVARTFLNNLLGGGVRLRGVKMAAGRKRAVQMFGSSRGLESGQALTGNRRGWRITIRRMTDNRNSDFHSMRII